MSEAGPQPKKATEPLQVLLDKAEEQGFLTVDDVLELFPKSDKRLPQIEDVMMFLYNEGIDIINDDGDEEPEAPDAEAETETEDDLEAPEARSKAADVSAISSDDSISLYLKQMASVPLLTREEEVVLAKEMERGRMARRRLEKGGQSPALHQRYLQHLDAGRRARAHLIKANTRLVVSIAKRYMGQGVPFLDLIQEGNLGLMKAVDKFDHRRGCKFSTYATWWIRQSITRALAQQGRVIRLPSHIGDRIRKMYRAAQQLEQSTGQRPTLKEIADHMGVTAGRVRWRIKVSRRPLSLEKPVGEEQDSELGEFIEDEDSPTPPESATQHMLSDELEDLLSSLTPREARILRLRFGLQDGHAYTLKEVGAKFGLTRERIRQIERQALRRLRHPSRSRHLSAFVR